MLRPKTINGKNVLTPRPVRKQSITVLLHVHTSLQGTESQQDQNHHLEENQAIADALEIL